MRVRVCDKRGFFLEFPSPTFQTCWHTCALHTLSSTSQCISQQQVYEPQAVCACVTTKQNMMDTTAQEEFPRCVRNCADMFCISPGSPGCVRLLGLLLHACTSPPPLPSFYIHLQ